METFLIRALQLIMSLSLLVIVHEGDTSFLRACSRRGWKSSAYSLTLGSHYSSSSPNTVTRNTVSGGYL